MFIATRFTYIYIFIFAVFSMQFLPLTRSLHSNLESVSTALRSSGSLFLTAGPFFSARFTARYARGNYAANFYAHFIFFFHVHTYARTSETAYSATMLQITGELAGNINIESLKVPSSECVSPLLRERSFSDRTAIAVLRAFCVTGTED